MIHPNVYHSLSFIINRSEQSSWAIGFQARHNFKSLSLRKKRIPPKVGELVLMTSDRSLKLWSGGASSDCCYKIACKEDCLMNSLLWAFIVTNLARRSKEIQKGQLSIRLHATFSKEIPQYGTQRSIIDGQTPVVRLQSSQAGFSQLPQEPIHLARKCLPSQGEKMLFDLLHSHDRTRPQFILQVSISDLSLRMDDLPEILAVDKHPFSFQYLRHSIVRKHGQFINIFEFSQATPVELSINISNQDLGPFVKMDLMALVNAMVLEIREVFCQDREQLYC